MKSKAGADPGGVLERLERAQTEGGVKAILYIGCAPSDTTALHGTCKPGGPTWEELLKAEPSEELGRDEP